ncbi:MAG: hypothetical protein JSV79_10970 [Armatimonadota bacterium]|nr:MAG: hypothetical protein JSV79_10970 [Armatimonadota bacterium]
MWAWCASFPLAHWLMSPPEQRARLAAVGAVFAVAVGTYAWHNRWWFATGSGLPAPPYRGVAEPAVGADSGRRPEESRRVFSITWPRSFAIFRDVLPQSYRNLPPLFYQFITAGVAFGVVALVASVTVLPIHAADSPSSLAQASLVVAPALGVLGILQAVGLLIRARWALWSLYAWLLAIAVAAWLYLPHLSSNPVWPILVTACLALSAYYFYKRRNWFRRSR